MYGFTAFTYKDYSFSFLVYGVIALTFSAPKKLLQMNVAANSDQAPMQGAPPEQRQRRGLTVVGDEVRSGPDYLNGRTETQGSQGKLWTCAMCLGVWLIRNYIFILFLTMS